MTYRSKESVQAREAFTDAIYKISKTPDLEIIRLLMKACITHHKLQECSCNGCTREKGKTESWPDYDKAREIQQAWIEARTEAIESLIGKYCKELGLFALFEGDPRGPTVRLCATKFEDQWYNLKQRYDVLNADVWNWR